MGNNDFEQNDLPAEVKENKVMKSYVDNTTDVLRMMENTMTMAHNITSDIKDITTIVSNTKLKIAELDHQLDLAILEAQKDVHLYEISLPTFERQLDRIQDRIDKYTDKILELSNEEASPNVLEKQKIFISAMESFNNQFNMMITKLMMR
jgi:CII-binding regulator of phage lambda lysogenization HflD